MPGPEEMGLDRANWHGEDCSHLFIRHLLEVAQYQHTAIFSRQLLHLLAHYGQPVASFQDIFYPLLLVHPIQDLFRLYDCLQVPLALASFQLSQTAMVGDAIEPGRKARLAAKRWQPLPRGHKRLLGSLTGVLVVLHHAQTQIENAALMPPHEEGEGILVSLLTGFHELCVVLLGLRRDDTWQGYLQGMCYLHQILVPKTCSCCY